MRRILIVGGVAVGVVVVAVLAFLNLTVSPGTALGRSRPDWGSAGTNLGGKIGFTVHVTDIQRNAPIARSHYVIMSLIFSNTSDSQQRADPLDFTLRAGGAALRPVFIPKTACAVWPRTDLYPRNGAGQQLRDPGGRAAGQTFGPATLCFPAPAPRSRTLTLIWDPDVSAPFFDSPTHIPLR